MQDKDGKGLVDREKLRLALVHTSHGVFFAGEAYQIIVDLLRAKKLMEPEFGKLCRQMS
jgi:hypothetical protein